MIDLSLENWKNAKVVSEFNFKRPTIFGDSSEIELKLINGTIVDKDNYDKIIKQFYSDIENSIRAQKEWENEVPPYNKSAIEYIYVDFHDEEHPEHYLPGIYSLGDVWFIKDGKPWAWMKQG